jgi:alpha-L-rhamnosidase
MNSRGSSPSETGGRTFDRRRFIRSVGATGIAGFAGCLGGDDGTTTTAPGDGGETTAPEDGGETTAPGDDGETATPDDGGGQPSPVALRVEHEQEPINLYPGSSPRFGWEIPTDSRGVEQTAYQIRVATDENGLEDPDVWDSGTVESSTSVRVPYDGPDLEPDTTYHWTVRVRDGDRESEWSDPARFTTALPESGWEGEWIGPDYDESGSGRAMSWTDYTLESTFTIEETAAGFLIRAQASDTFYLWQVVLESSPQNDTGSHLLRPHLFDGGDVVVLGADDQPISESGVPIGDVIDQPHGEQHVEIEVAGDGITTRINGQQVDARTDSTLDSGTVGFRQNAGDDEHVRVDALEVRDPDGGVLFTDDFADPTDAFADGTVGDGALDLDGTDVTLLETDGSEFDRPAPLLRREFDVEGEVESARVHVSGLGYYELHLNGERVGERMLDPAMTDYEHTILYSTYDVTDALSAGTNVVGAELGRGRFGEPRENVWNWHDAPWWSDPQLRLQLDVAFADGSSTSIVSDGEWAVTDGPIRYDSLFGGETYDARKTEPGWTTADYDDSGWDDAGIADDPGGELRPQRIQPMEIADTVEPVTLTELDDGGYVFDLGVVIAGWVELTVDGPAGTEVTLIQGEKRHGDGTVNNDNRHLAEPMQTDTYVLSGEGTETWEARFSYKGVRYVQVEGYPGTPTVEDLRGKVVHTRIDEGAGGEFECSNELLNRIHENNHRAFLNNMHGVPTDTPKFEKNGWTGDALATAEKGIYNFDMARFWRKWLRDCRDAQADAPDVVGEEGNLPVIVPTSDWGYEGWTPDPAWQSAFVLIPWWCYRYYGDRRFLEENYEGMHQYMKYLEGHADDGVVRAGLGDWASPGNPGQPPEAPDVVSTCYYYRDAEVMAETAETLGNDGEAAMYEALAEEIRAGLNAEYLDETEGYYRSRQRGGDAWLGEYRQTDNAMPLAFGMVPGEHEEAVVGNLVTDVMETRNGHLNTGVHGTKFLLPALTEYGHLDVAYAVATATDHPSWGHWVENGMTALLEFWELDARSRSHHFLGTVDEWFYKYLAGIRVGDPGFERVEIAPHVPGDLNSVDAQVDTVRGTVASSWRRGVSRFTLDVTVPGNTTAEVRIPTVGDGDVLVREDDETIWERGEPSGVDRPGIETIERVDDGVVVTVGGGAYRFELRQI